MKKITLLLSFLTVAFLSSAQTKITFEDASIGSAGGTSPVWSAGTVDVVANTYTTGNSSAKALHVLNTNYLGVYFDGVAMPANAVTAYSSLRMKYLIIGGTDKDYPTLEIFSSPNNYTMGATEKIGSLGWSALWGTAEIGVWKTIEFPFANSLITPSPAGNLILKLSKSNTEYLIDDVELVSAIPASSIVIVNNFESNAVNDVLNMKRTIVTDGTATVTANPTISAEKSVHIVTTNYDALLKQTVVLPTGKVLADYDKLSFDIYLISTGSNNYKKMQLYVDGTKVYEDASYPSQATNETWTTKSYTLNKLAGANSFVLDLGISTNAGDYYIDNIKLTEATTTGLTRAEVTPLFVNLTSTAFVISNSVQSYKLFNLQGSCVSEGCNTSTINTANLQRGIYILNANYKGQTFTTKLVK